MMSEKIFENIATPTDTQDFRDLSSTVVAQSPSGELEATNRPLPRYSTPLRTARRIRSFRPIIMIFMMFLSLASGSLFAQLTGSVTLGTRYSDNVFQLSENDLSRFDDEHSSLDFVKTSDDMILDTRIELAYPMHYRWWKITPSVIGNISQAVSNTEKYRRDASVKLRVDRYYWNLSAQYSYNPHIYYRNFNDADGSGNSEEYCYSRNGYRADIAVKPIKNTTLKGNFRIEDYFYNQYFTEADGQALTGGLGVNYRFPVFSLDCGYSYRSFTNDNKVDTDDASYESNIYQGKITLPKMQLSDKGTTKWQPSLGINYEQRYYQGNDSWYGGRADFTYTMNAGFDLIFPSRWEIGLDYSHIFRNVESDNSSVLQSKEYGENRLGANLNYKF
ncbi:MAG: hypothetical protein PHO32_09345 [Candidatus Cloacimonetes bacterium]|nr:hypothetical protein [Candidatus Cloacimonadota bacterium]